MLDEEKYEFLTTTELFYERPELLNEFINDSDVVNTVNSVEIDKMDFLLDRFCLNSSNEPYVLAEVKKIFQNQWTIDIINSARIDKLRLLDFDDELDTDRFKWLLENEDARIAFKLIEFERLDLILNYDIDPSDFILKDMLIKDAETINAINSFDMDRLKLIYEKGKFDNLSFMQIFQTANVINVIATMDIGRLEALLESGQMCVEFLGKKNFVSKWGELVINNDKYYNINEMNLIDFGKIDFEKLRMIVEIDLFGCMAMLKLIRTQDNIDTINSLDIKKFEAIFNYKKETYPVCLLRKPGKLNFESVLYDYLKYPECMSMLNYRNLFLKILLKSEFNNAVNSMDIEKLILLLKCPKNEVTTYDMIGSLLLMPKFLHFVDSVNVDKLKVLFESYIIDTSPTFIEFFENTLSFIKTIDVEKLRVITMMNEIDFIKLSKCYKGDVMQNLDFAIALFKGGAISEVNINLILNKKLIKKEIKKIFPKDFPIDEILNPTAITNGKLVLKLKYISLKAVIGQVL